MISKLLSVVVLVFLVGSNPGQAAQQCKLAKARILNWDKLSGIWYNTFSHVEDATQLEGRCNSIVVAGSFGHDGVAVVRNVMPQILTPDGKKDVAPKSVPEYFMAVDPGIYKLDQSSELQWINTKILEQIMTKERMTSYVNAISDHYTNDFAITTNYKNFLMISQCNREGKYSVWVYTKTPNPDEEVKTDVENNMTHRRINAELQKNDACVATINSIFEQGSVPK
uniref:uncharacterized protein LOC120326988 n=1 Tax=Styela clava TaxID=7725 RepID=UPI0019396044|nr:uncharacterized protein LOC120326988 [Styela clava]